MEYRFKLAHRRDWQLLVLVVANLVCVGGFLASNLGDSQPTTGGWRKIDFQALQTRIESGELSSQEASWYHRHEPSSNAGENRVTNLEWNE